MAGDCRGKCPRLMPDRRGVRRQPQGLEHVALSRRALWRLFRNVRSAPGQPDLPALAKAAHIIRGHVFCALARESANELASIGKVVLADRKSTRLNSSH